MMGVHDLKLFALTMIIWSLWTAHDKMAIEGVFPKDHADVLFKIHTCMQQWTLGVLMRRIWTK
jgi:hypothetical protein